ncbi:MAG: 4-phosphoerythronate dehydrogenase PdxB [Prolixibacteraceae bacterium]|nr:4-phosphoerythronate dehydrogenase PdxB [Prolixibacteraceae bacterium]
MKIIIDDKIPYIRGTLEPFADVVYLPGSKTTPGVVKDADALITRTRTKCNENLLKDSKVKFIATATIGYDHIDTDYCSKAGIEWTNAPGCNAESVNQYIASALFSCSLKKGFDLKDKTIGIIGVGHVGSRVARLCNTIGMKVLLNDPPRERIEGSEKFASLEKICNEADIISFHVPLNVTGQDATLHMVNMSLLKSMKKKPLLINSCRGEVFDTESVIAAFNEKIISGVIVDCWENEPDINLDLLEIADFGTPHIAGYSKDGKANGTKMSVRAVSRFFNLGNDNWEHGDVERPGKTVIEIDGKNRKENSLLAEVILATYEIKKDDENLRKDTGSFERLRGDYPVRREFGIYTILAKNVMPETLDKFIKLGFNVEVG